jgi:hypothetical protein
MTAPGGLAVSYADIPAIPLDWLWKDHLPRKTPVIWAAKGGTGKGLACHACIAIAVTGAAWPGEEPGTLHEPMSVVLVAPEDFANETVAYRLRAAIAAVDAPPERKADAAGYVFDLTEMPDGTPFELPSHVGKLREAIEQINGRGDVPPVGLVVIDPLMACLEKPITSQLGARRVLYPLQSLARETNVGMVVTHHMTKDGKTIMGATALTDAARLVFTVTRDEANDAYRVMKPYKANIADDSATTRYTVVKNGAESFAVFGDQSDAAQGTSTRIVDRDHATAEPAGTPQAGYVAATAQRYRAPVLPGETGVRAGVLYDAPDYEVPPYQPAQRYRVLRRGTSRGGVKDAGEVLADACMTAHAARSAAESDAGEFLDWTDARDSPGMELALQRHADGSMHSYAISPVTE